MASENEGRRTRRKGGAGRGGNGNARPVEEAGQGGGVTMVNLDLWGSLFENFWEKAEDESVDRPDGGRKLAKGTRTTVTRPGRQGRAPRAS